MQFYLEGVAELLESDNNSSLPIVVIYNSKPHFVHTSLESYPPILKANPFPQVTTFTRILGALASGTNPITVAKLAKD